MNSGFSHSLKDLKRSREEEIITVAGVVPHWIATVVWDRRKRCLQ